MTGTDEHRVRGRLVRLVAVVAVLVGVVVLHSPICTDGMSAATQVAMAADMNMNADAHPDHDMPEPGGAGGVLASCLALVVTVLIAVAGLLLPGQWVAVRAGPISAIMSLDAVHVRPPRLAQLCVLRI